MPAIRANGRKPFQPAWPPLSSLVRVLVWVLLLCVCASVRACVCASASARLFFCVRCCLDATFWRSLVLLVARGSTRTRQSPLGVYGGRVGPALARVVVMGPGGGGGFSFASVRACVLCPFLRVFCAGASLPHVGLKKCLVIRWRSRVKLSRNPFIANAEDPHNTRDCTSCPRQSCAGFPGVVSENCRTPFQMIPGIA